MGNAKLSTVEKIKAALLNHNVELYIHDDVVKDFKKMDHYNISIMIALILKRAQLGLSIPPAEPLNKDLTGYAKIKNRKYPFRGVYKSKVLENGRIAMYLIAIGPKDNEKVYKVATGRTNHTNSYFDIE